MNRVRALIGGGSNRGRARRNHGQPVGNDTGLLESQPRMMMTNDIDQFSMFDQQTVIDGTNDEDNDSGGDDTETISELQTFISESQTIGDLQTRGYVNRCPSFNSIRTIPFVSIILTKGFFAFPSQASFSKYLSNKRKLKDPTMFYDGGLGVPLFHGITSNVIKSLLLSSGKQKTESVMKIYKHEIVPKFKGLNLSQFPSYEIILEDEKYILIKFEFCQIFKEADPLDSLRVIHTLKFYNNDEVSMVNYSDKKDIDTNVEDLPLRWFGFSGFASPFGSSDIKLLVLDDNMPTFMNEVNVTNDPQITSSRRPLKALPVWARYSDTDSSMLPTKRTVRLANLKIKETVMSSENDDEDSSQGIIDVHRSTQILTCMCMMLHEYESRKERRHMSASNDNIKSSESRAVTRENI